MFIASPLKYRIITQPFGVNYISWYKDILGISGHNGLDMRAEKGTNLLAVCNGIIQSVGESENGGLFIKYFSDIFGTQRFLFFCCHLSEIFVKYGSLIKKGDVIGKTGNSGKLTTAPHLHFGMYEYMLCNNNWEKCSKDNGLDGAIDPQPYFEDGRLELIPVDIHYSKPRSWIIEYMTRFKTPLIHKALMQDKRHSLSLTERELNALVYGHWNINDVLEPSMFALWGAQTKEDFNSKKPVPIRLTLN
jgi:hypothetical protein